MLCFPYAPTIGARRRRLLKLQLVAGIFVLSTAGIASASPSKFDLVCQVIAYEASGVVSPASLRLTHGLHYTMRYRVDLAAGVYCAGDCPRTGAFQRVDPDALVFADESYGTMDFYDMRISRTSGQFYRMRYTRSRSELDEGPCAVEPFSGFPPPPAPPPRRF